MATWKLCSVKSSETFDGTLLQAIQAAVEMETDLQPAFGVDVHDESGERVVTILDGEMESVDD
jgi:hypothetical protein